MYYPINVDLREKECLVAGGGNVAERKVKSLREAGGNVSVISPEATPQIKEWALNGDIRWEQRAFETGDLDGVFLVIGATDSGPVHETIYRECQKKSILVNIVDEPAKCNFTVPSLFRRGNLSIAVSTNGASPAVSKRIRTQLEKIYGEETALFLEWMGEARKKVLNECDGPAERKKIFDSLADSQVLELLQRGETNKAKEVFSAMLNEALTQREHHV